MEGNTTHEDEILNTLIGQEVSITFYDGMTVVGKLNRGDGWGYHKEFYRIDGANGRTILFRKSHVVRINGRRRRK